MEMTDIIVILAPGASDKLDDEMLATEFCATNIERLSEGCIACTVPASMIPQIEHNPFVAYIRRVQAYIGSIAS